MLSNRKGNEGMWWTIAGAGIALIILIILIFAFLSEGGIWGKTKVAITKFFEKGEEGIKLYKEYFGDNPSKQVIKAGLIKDFIITNLSRIENKDCIGYLDLSGINEDIDGYSVYFKKTDEGTDFYVYSGGKKDYGEILKDHLAYGHVSTNLFGYNPVFKEEYSEFWLLNGMTSIIFPVGVSYPLLYSSSKANNPYYLNYKDKRLRFVVLPDELSKINNPSINKC